jgi:hypothetical protein
MTLTQRRSVRLLLTGAVAAGACMVLPGCSGDGCSSLGTAGRPVQLIAAVRARPSEIVDPPDPRRDDFDPSRTPSGPNQCPSNG